MPGVLNPKRRPKNFVHTHLNQAGNGLSLEGQVWEAEGRQGSAHPRAETGEISALGVQRLTEKKKGKFELTS